MGIFRKDLTFPNPFKVMTMKNNFPKFSNKTRKIKKSLFLKLETLEAKTMKIRAKFTTRGSLNEIQKKKSIKNVSKK